MSGTPGPELARGRASAVYDLGDGRVLRRNPGSDPAREAAIMAHAGRYGIRVPLVHEARGHDLVMDRIEGPTMLADLIAHPERLDEHARTLAELHSALGQVPAPAAALRLATADDGAMLLHLDLHPANVICSPDGPVLIDWTNAMAGPRPVDVATTWLIVTCHDVPPELAPVIESARAALAEAFLARVDLEAVEAALPAASALQLANDALNQRERARISALVATSV